jgi:hypothetical protein
MGRSVAAVDGIHCRPHADRAKRARRAGGKQDLGESFFSVAKCDFFVCLRLAVGSSSYRPNALFSGRYWLLMVYDQNMVHTLYKKLLTFYPRTFRERLGDSMKQTFNNLYRERQTERGLFSFVFWTFTETGVRILQEHILLIKQGDGMKNMLSNPTSAAITSLILSLPLGLNFVAFMLDIQPLIKPLNDLFTIDGRHGEINTLGRIVIYGGLLLLPLAFVLNLRPLLRKEGAEGKRKLYALNLIIAVAILLLIILMWGGLLMEEIYCLRGIRCD